MDRDKIALTGDGFSISGIAAPFQKSGPLLVCIHGGSYTSRYFDIPGASLLDRAAANGISAVALDRPCYGGSSALKGEDVTFRHNADQLSAAVNELWKAHGKNHSGVVLLGHSIGGAIAMIMSSQRQPWPLLGLVISGIGDALPPGVADVWHSMPPGQPVTLAPEQRAAFMFGPEDTFEPSGFTDHLASASAVPVQELLEVVDRWPGEAREFASKIEVPVYYGVAEHEKLWVLNDKTVKEFVSAFSRAPYIESHVERGAGHCLDHHRAGAGFQLRELAFVLEV
jgi:pimeloyl-ACP methyl ester carboxylesterase